MTPLHELTSRNGLRNAALLAEYAKLAYCEPHERSRRTRSIPFDNIMSQGFVSVQDDIAVVSIAGTNDTGDALLDVLTTYQEVGGYYVHTGFLLYAVLVREAISNLDLAVNSFVFTGHSLGGAAAQLMPIIMPEADVRWVVTFGAPRTMCEDSTGRYLWNCMRFIRPEDVVPDYPPRRFLRFAHVGDERVIRGPGDVVTGRRDFLDRFRRALRLVTSRVRGRGSLKSAISRGHSISDYAEMLAPLA